MFEITAIFLIIGLIIILVINRTSKNCANCKHLDDHYYDSPCEECHDINLWESKND